MSSASPPRERRNRSLLWFALFAILALAALLGVAMLSDKTPSSAYPDLEPPEAVKIEPERNLYVALQRAAELYSEREPTEPVADWLERNANTIDAVRAAASLIEYAPPAEVGVDTEAERYAVASRAHHLADLWSLHVSALRDGEELDRAFDDSLAFLVLACRVREGARILVDMTAAMAMSHAATQPLLERVQGGSLRADQLQRLLSVLAARNPWIEDADRVLRCEFTFAAELIRTAASSGEVEDLVPPGTAFPPVPPSLIIKPHRTIDELAGRVRDVQNELRHPLDESASEERSGRLETAAATVRGNFLGHQLGKAYAVYLRSLVSLGRAQEKQLIVLELAAALALREANGKAAPTTLEELCAGVIDPLPTDPYTLEPVPFDPDHSTVRFGRLWHSLTSTETEPAEAPR